MKAASLLISLGLAMLTGCASAPVPVQAPQAPTVEDDETFVLPADYGRPGSVEMSWQPSAPAPEEKVEAREQTAKPHFVSTKKRSLFMLPVTRGH